MSCLQYKKPLQNSRQMSSKFFLDCAQCTGLIHSTCYPVIKLSKPGFCKGILNGDTFYFTCTHCSSRPEHELPLTSTPLDKSQRSRPIKRKADVDLDAAFLEDPEFNAILPVITPAEVKKPKLNSSPIEVTSVTRHVSNEGKYFSNSITKREAHCRRSSPPLVKESSVRHVSFEMPPKDHAVERNASSTGSTVCVAKCSRHGGLSHHCYVVEKDGKFLSSKKCNCASKPGSEIRTELRNCAKKQRPINRHKPAAAAIAEKTIKQVAGKYGAVRKWPNVNSVACGVVHSAQNIVTSSIPNVNIIELH